MSEENSSQSEIELSPAAFPLGPGSVLKQAREACHLTQEDIAQRLHLSVQRIQEIEENDFSQMKAVIYAQGYLRAYADIVQLPVESILASFKNLEWARQEKAATQQDKSDKWVKNFLPLGKASTRLWFYVGAAVLTALAILLALDYWPKQEAVKSQAAVAALTGPSVVMPINAVRDDVSSNALVQVPAKTAEINLPNAAAAETDNPFVQPLAKTPAKAPIVEAEPVSSPKANS